MAYWESYDSDGNRVYIEKHYPKRITNTFDALIAGVDFNDIRVDKKYAPTCKRCGKEFIRKKINQVFCSRECISAYNIAINEMKYTYGKDFTDWIKI